MLYAGKKLKILFDTGVDAKGNDYFFYAETEKEMKQYYTITVLNAHVKKGDSIIIEKIKNVSSSIYIDKNGKANPKVFLGINIMIYGNSKKEENHSLPQDNEDDLPFY